MIFPMGGVLRTFSGLTLASTPFAGALRAADELEGPAVAAGVAQGLRGQVADAFALDVFQADRDIHQNGDQGGGFDGGVPAVDVVGGVGFGDAEGLRFFQGFVEGEALLHLARGSRWWSS